MRAQALGVPLDSQHQALPLLLDRLDRPVGGPGGGHQAPAELLHRLVVERVHRDRRAAEHRPDGAAGRGGDDVGGNARVLVLTMARVLADHVGQVLMERAATGHVQHLHAAADAEDRQTASIRSADQGQLERVDPRLGRAELLVGAGAIGGGLDVGTAGQADAVHAVEERPDRLRAHRGNDHRDAAGSLDRLRIQGRQRELEPGRLALGRMAAVLGAAQLGGGERDDRSHD